MFLQMKCEMKSGKVLFGNATLLPIFHMMMMMMILAICNLLLLLMMFFVFLAEQKWEEVQEDL